MNRPDGYDVSAPRLPDDRAEPPPGRALCFAPHPDDEVIGPGGALCMHRRRGDAVRVVVATDGVGGDPDRRFERDGYPARRRGESRAGLRCLGVDDVEFWGYPDGCVVTPGDLTALRARVVDEIARYRPDVVYAPWAGENHSDHRALHAAVAGGVRDCAFAGIALGYEVWTPLVPDFLLDITGVADDKRRAIACYETQLAYVDYVRTIFGLHAHRSLQFRRGRGYSEAYARLI